MRYQSSENKSCYFPPLLSNGEISFAPDREGCLGYTYEEFRSKGLNGFDGIVVRAARRSPLCNSLQARLFPFGVFTFKEGSGITDWSQTLETKKGLVESDCTYEDGVTIHSESLIHPEKNIYALRKTFYNGKKTKEFAYEVTLCGYNESISQYMEVRYVEKRGDVGCIGFKMYGMDVYSGEIQIFVDKEYTMTAKENGCRLVFDAAEGEAVTFYYALEDNANGVNFEEVLKNYKQTIEASGFDGLRAECEAHFGVFYDLGYVKTSDEKLNSIYETSLYSIKCNTTKSSISVGFNNGSWDGRYFAFDEYTSYRGLLGANRLELAKRVPLFRLNTCLKPAIRRASDCHRTAETEDMARFHWEEGDEGWLELAPDGNWKDHIFHIPLVGMGAFQYYEFSQDLDFLRECYPMIRACAKFITKHMVYQEGEKLYIGKCTDLERLGSSVKNPFLSVCGAIQLLECCKKAADLLGTDGAYADECRYIAGKLRENLPVQEGRYVPFLDCKQKSIAVFGGKFPFDVLTDTDEKMRSAWEDFEHNGANYGNMYPMGKSISSWYACWKASGYARAKMTEKAYDALRQAYPSAGVFGELFEINEENLHLKPWFATAAGIFVSTVHDMLLQSDGKTITILPAYPHDTDLSFRLAAVGGVTVEAEVKNGALQSVAVRRNGMDVTDQFTIVF